ncbi:transposase [Vibrio rotiferianus]|uniref:transposase n=1 Tax=Vibrio rotiferianus TaxID=190895 RepID=UPI00406A8A82
MVDPWVNKTIMIEHLSQMSEVTEEGRYAVVIMDGEGWHTDDIAEPFDNLSIIKLPPYSPELNLIEQVWRVSCANAILRTKVLRTTTTL